MEFWKNSKHGGTFLSSCTFRRTCCFPVLTNLSDSKKNVEVFICFDLEIPTITNIFKDNSLEVQIETNEIDSSITPTRMFTKNPIMKKASGEKCLGGREVRALGT
jgi:hypothetical protein